MKCISCGINLLNEEYVEFDCPNCLEEKIRRCLRCRKLGVKYVCPNCGFEGP